MPNIINRTSRKTVNQVLSVLLGVSMLVWLGGFAAVTPTAEAQTTAELIAQLQAQIVALQAQLNALLGQVQTGGAVQCSFTRSLYVGVSGEDVRCLQQYLNASGYQVAASGPGSPGSETAYYGPLTQTAVAKWQAANAVAPAVGYFGPISRAKYSTLVVSGVTPAPGAPVVVGSQVGVSLAPTTPVSGVAPKGASGVKMLSVNFTAPASGEVTVTDVIVHRNGVGRSADFSQVYLYDGSSRLTSGRTVNSATNNAEFHNLSVKVAAGTTKTLDVVADMSATAYAGDVNYFELVSASSVGSNAAVVGTFPVRGNNFSIAGATAGTITIADLVPGTNPKVGDLQAEIAKFSLRAGSAEDLSLRRITLYNGGNLGTANLGNLKLNSAGNTLATSAGMDSKGYIVFDLATPHVITKGNTLNYEVTGDILSGARADDTIALRLDQSTDLLATGNTYGYGATVTATGYATGTTLTLQGGQVTITFNGPIAQNWSKGTSAVELLNFSITTKNNTEFRAINLTLATATSSGGSDSGLGDGTNTFFTNVRVLDTTTGLIVSGPSDATAVDTSTENISFTDRFQQNAGTTHNYKILVDLSASVVQQDVRVTLLTTSFTTAGNVKNIDNNTNITDIVPNTNIQGNLQHILTNALTLTLAGTPVSQTYVRGSQNVDLVGFNFTSGLGGDVKINSITTTAYNSASGGTFAAATSTARYLALRLVDQSTGNQIGTAQGVSTSDGTSAFTNLSFTVPAGTTKTIVVRADLSNNALSPSDGERIKVDIAATTSVTANDIKGNSVSITGAQPNGITANSGTLITIGDAGTLNVVKAPDDSESQQSIVIAGSANAVIAKFRITAVNESLKITKSRFQLASTTSYRAATALTLWDGPTQVGGPVVVNSLGRADFTNVNFVISKDASKVLTVKSNLNTIAGGAQSGDLVKIQYATTSGTFEAVGTSPGSSTQLTEYSGTQAEGNQMTLRKTKPTVTVTARTNKVAVGDVELAKVSISADAAEQLAVKHMTFSISLTSATLTANSLSIYDLDTSETLTATNTLAQTGGIGNLTLTTERTVAAGGTKNFVIKANVAAVIGGTTVSTIQTKLLNASDTTLTTGTLSGESIAAEYIVDNTSAASSTPSFIWSDYSVVGHAETSADYTNGRDLKDFNTTVAVSS